jgi:hypothetical protein
VEYSNNLEYFWIFWDILGYFEFRNLQENRDKIKENVCRIWILWILEIQKNRRDKKGKCL